MHLDPSDFKSLRDLVYARTGLMFEDRKRAFVENRLARRAQVLGIASAAAYCRHIYNLDPNGVEFQSLVEELTTNETYFFRDYPQLELFANEVLPGMAAQKRARGDWSLRLWSAPCSTGDEAYTLAIILAACLDDFPSWRVRVLGTDLDRRVLEAARRARYGDRSLRDVPSEYVQTYFTRVGEEYQVCDRIRGMVDFKQVNLIDAEAMHRYSGFDVIFCRNVLIYFDDASRSQALKHLYDALTPGGFVFLGHAESVVRISAAFQPVPFGKSIVYRRPTVRQRGVGARDTDRFQPPPF